MRKIHVFISLLFICACTGEPPAREEAELKPQIDERSYQLGVIGAFSEVVAAGVKKLALSSPMTPEEMDALMEDTERIAGDNGANIYREEDFLVTDLFPESITEGKHVLVIYLDPVKEEYLALKAEKEALVEKGAYEGEARREIARKMGRLLSYPEERIEQMLSSRSQPEASRDP
jgi:hypothetical protein